MIYSPQDSVDNAFLELYKQFCRLKGYKTPTSPIAKMVDEATGVEKARMQEFAKWMFDEILPRMEPQS